jgi:ribosomal protein S18 acetylase RimI-like enzyme
MPEPTVTIRRITQDEGEAVVELWDRMCQAAVDGGPLRPCGRRNLRRMLEIAAFHRETFCLVAVRPGAGDAGEEIVGFAMGRIDAGDGLLPGFVGQAEELYATDDGVRHMLAEAVVERLEAAGAQTIRRSVAADEPQWRAFWEGHGFEADMVTLSRYRSGPCPGCGSEVRPVDCATDTAGSAGDAG